MATLTLSQPRSVDPRTRMVAAFVAILAVFGLMMGSCSDRGSSGGGWQQQVRDVGGNPRDAYCTECHEWYDSSKPGQVNRHAH